MSSDDRESVIMKALASGVVFYILKPLNPDDLKNVWQYAITYKKAKSVLIDEIGSFEGAGSSANKFSCDDIVSTSSTNERNKNKKDSKRKASKKGEGKQQVETATAPKKPKVAWTNSLHNRFLLAIRHISLESKFLSSWTITFIQLLTIILISTFFFPFVKFNSCRSCSEENSGIHECSRINKGKCG